MGLNNFFNARNIRRASWERWERNRRKGERDNEEERKREERRWDGEWMKE